uniref:HTH CENPB-type domain-containing protein n=1 Tax=Bionectria ochroleuca TaxID=29856 RepID=A0A0B7K3L4_BIOOC
MAIYSESEINSAINNILAGLSAIPRTTLRRRLEDGFTRAQAHEHQQRLSKAEEERVRRWIVSQELLGYAPTYRQLRYIASQILQGRKDLEPLGRSWIN